MRPTSRADDLVSWQNSRFILDMPEGVSGTGKRADTRLQQISSRDVGFADLCGRGVIECVLGLRRD